MPEQKPKSSAPRSKQKPPAKGRKAGGSGFNKKVAGLPIWGWGVLILAAVGIGLYIRHRSGGTTSTGVAAPDESASGGGPVGAGVGTEPTDLSGLEAEIADLRQEIANLPTDTGNGSGNGDGKPPPHHAKKAGARHNPYAVTHHGHNKAESARSHHHHRPSKPQTHTKNTKHPPSHHPQAAATEGQRSKLARKVGRERARGGYHARPAP
jgi:hypothetical protein